MAKVSYNPVVKRIQGQIGDLVFKRLQDRNLVARKPDLAGREPTPGQAAHRDRFRQATRYAKSVWTDPVRKAAYQALTPSRKLHVFQLCVADYLNPPEIHATDLSAYTGGVNQPIRIVARDDVEVVSVRVRITGPGETLIEEGEAVRQAEDAWVYTTTAMAPAGQVLTVTVTATDRPGNQTPLTMTTA